MHLCSAERFRECLPAAVLAFWSLRDAVWQLSRHLKQQAVMFWRIIMMRSDVLIAGAGPTGLVLALWLTKLGAKIRIIDKTAEPGTTSRALAVHARTLELYRQLDLTDAVIAEGHRVPAVNLWVQGEREARLAFENIGTGLTPYPFLHIFPQDQHERLLIERLETFGVRVERRTELIGFTERDHGVSARLRGADGDEQECTASYIAGC